MKIIGRDEEQSALQQYVESDKSEFIAVYGRRRVGKTFLIKEFFNNTFSFYISGMANASKKEQLENFNATLISYGQMPYSKINLSSTKNWTKICETKNRHSFAKQKYVKPYTSQ